MYNSAQYEAESTFGLSKPILIGIIYRPPILPIKEFNNDIEILLENINKEKSFMYIAGDFNINTLVNHTFRFF